jgi:hypothetical protein
MKGRLLGSGLIVALAAVATSATVLWLAADPGQLVSLEPPTFSCGQNTNPIEIQPTMPANFYSGDGQAGADCMAWQEFIYLNWPADPNSPGEPDRSVTSSSFGNPNNYTSVWESYPLSASVFTAGASLRSALVQATQPKTLQATSKLGDLVVDLSGVSQAGNNAWLTDQSQGLTYYEVRINKDEAQYITDNGLGSAAGQNACARQAGGFNLPQGANSVNCQGTQASYGDNMGAVELKAAWIELTDPSTYPNYFTAEAEIHPPGSPPHQGIVGLVGLHVIHKVPNAQQFIWATFEHVDNAPDTTHATASPTPYAFYNPACDPSTDYYKCAVNHQPQRNDPYTAPVQVVRTTAIGTQDAIPVNSYAWSQMAADSVFRHYELVDVIWPNSNQSIGSGATVPLACGDSTSESSTSHSTLKYCGSAGVVANTTMETYFQGQLNCLTCHTSASVASQSVARPAAVVLGAAGRPARVVRLAAPGVAMATTSALAADYSFIFFANSPTR